MTVASASSTSSTSSTASTPTSGDGGLKRIVLYILRRDLRVSDNPILHHLATADHGFTHLIPVFVVPPHQVEVSGFLQNGTSSPYPEARSQVGGYWRCGPRRAKFLAQSVWDLRQSLEDIGSGLLIRIGSYEHVVSDLLAGLDTSHSRVDAVWMTKEDTSEEVDDQEAVSRVCDRHKVEFKRWMDEKYFLDDRDLNLGSDGIHDVFTDFRKSQEPLREKPRAVLPTPAKSTLPPFPDDSTKIPRQSLPFDVPASLDDFEDRLTKPVKHPISDAPAWPQGALSAHPFEGGETNAQARLHHLIVGGHMVTYKDTRNGLIGKDYSTKLAAYLALGCITARQVHGLLVKFENGTDERFENTTGYGNGENEGTAAVRLELMWRDYMRLCARKFGNRLFRLSGFGKSNPDKKAYTWRSADKNSAPASQTETPEEIGRIIGRFLRGTTGMSLIDASQRELYLTGYTSNRARQNVANFFAKHLGIDWRYGAEWYESMLIDYDPSSNWCNWQYVAGVGNDPRGRERIFNPVKQGFEYDPNGRYVKMWVPELRAIERLENVFQPWTTPRAEMLPNGLVGLELAEDPVKRRSPCD
jgi:deoxyribodipyrimidine photo-lyase